MRKIGLHIRQVGTLADSALKALELQIPFFQCFLVMKSSGTIIRPTDQEIADFLKIRREHFTNLYVHGSYWINLAGIAHNGHKALSRELRLAKKLEFTHMIMHPGSAKGAQHRNEGIDALATSLNQLFKHETEMKFVLENSAHGGLSVGGDIQDFGLLLSKIDKPEQLTFCIDTAHAYSYGYNITDPQERTTFIQLIDDSIGLDKISLIHLNDSAEKCGSKLDRHEVIGEGRIGKEALKAFVLDSRLEALPLLMELPVVSPEKEQEALALVRSWHSN